MSIHELPRFLNQKRQIRILSPPRKWEQLHFWPYIRKSLDILSSVVTIDGKDNSNLEVPPQSLDHIELGLLTTRMNRIRQKRCNDQDRLHINYIVSQLTPLARYRVSPCVEHDGIGHDRRLPLIFLKSVNMTKSQG